MCIPNKQAKNKISNFTKKKKVIEFLNNRYR